MSISFAVLWILSYSPMTGYDLKKIILDYLQISEMQHNGS